MKRFLISAGLLAAILNALAAAPAAASCGHSDPSTYTSRVLLTEKLLNRLKGMSVSNVRLTLGVAGCNVLNDPLLRFDMKTPSGVEGTVNVGYRGEKVERIEAAIPVPGSSGFIQWRWSVDGELNCSDFEGSHHRRCE